MEILFEIQENCLTYLSNLIGKHCNYSKSEWLLNFLDNVNVLVEKIGKECEDEVNRNIRWNNGLKVGPFQLPIVDSSNYEDIKFAWKQQFDYLAYSIRRIYDCEEVAKKYGLRRDMLEAALEEFYKNDNGEPFVEYIQTKFKYHEVEEMCNALYLELMNINCEKNELPSENASDYEKLCFAYIVAERLNKAANFLNSEYLFEKENAEIIDKAIKNSLEDDFKATNSFTPQPIPSAPRNREISFSKASLIGAGCGAALGIGVGVLTKIPLLILVGIGAGFVISNIIRVKKNRKEREIYDKAFSEYSKEKSKIESKNKQTLLEMKQVYYSQFSRDLLDEVEGDLENLTFVLQSLIIASTKILNLPLFNFLPEKYKYSATALGTFVEYYNDRRVKSIQEAVNLYVSESRENEHRQEMLRLEQIKIQEQQKAIAQQQKQEAERNRLLKQMTQTVTEIKRSEVESEKQRQKDADDLKESLSSAKKTLDETKDKLTNLQEETDNLKKMLKD